MKKILKKGKKTEKKKFKCEICGCEFETDEYLTQLTSGGHISVDECPNCEGYAYREELN